MFEKTYTDDVAVHGNPDNKISITLLKDMDAWLVTLNKAMEV
jgi:hypothetical protein